MVASRPSSWRPSATAAAAQKSLTDESGHAARTNRSAEAAGLDPKADASLAITGEPEDSKSSGGDGGEP